MAISFKSATWVVLLLLLALFLSSGCKPETPPNRAPQTGALMSPRATATRPISPLPTSTVPISQLPTPIDTGGLILVPYPTPWPPDFTPSPTVPPTPTPAGIPYVITDSVNHFTMTVLPGWYAYTPDARAIGGVTSISNYDLAHIDNRPPGGVSIQISIGPLGANQTFDQWLADRRRLETSAESGAFGITLTESQPFTLGQYAGVEYKAYSPSSEGTIVIYLLTADNQIVGIGLNPANVPALQDGLSILSTIKVSPEFPIVYPPTSNPPVAYDPVNRFSLQLLPGWRGTINRSGTVIANYDDTKLGDKGNLPTGALKIQIEINRLEQGQSFEQWLSNWIAASLAAPPGSGLSASTATAPEMETVGHYKGVTYFINKQPRVKEIVLPLDDGRIVIIGLTPSDSSALPAAFVMLSTINFSP